MCVEGSRGVIVCSKDAEWQIQQRLRAALSSEVAWSRCGAHLATPVIILILHQEGILLSFPGPAWGSHAWEIEQPAEGMSKERPEGVWTEREQSMRLRSSAHWKQTSQQSFSSSERWSYLIIQINIRERISNIWAIIQKECPVFKRVKTLNEFC